MKSILMFFLLFGFQDFTWAGAECRSPGIYNVKQRTDGKSKLVEHKSCNIYVLRDDRQLWKADSTRIQMLVNKGYFPTIIESSEAAKHMQKGDLVVRFANHSYSMFCLEEHIFSKDVLYTDAMETSFEEAYMSQVIRAGDQPLFKDVSYSFMRAEGWFQERGSLEQFVRDYVYQNIPTCKLTN